MGRPIFPREGGARSEETARRGRRRPKFTDDSQLKRGDRKDLVERRRTVATEAELNAKADAAWDALNRADSPASMSYPPTNYAEAKARPARARAASKPTTVKLGTLPTQRELRCVIAVVRHGDRTPKYVAPPGGRKIDGAARAGASSR